MTDTNDLPRTDAPERIWVDFAESPSGAMIGSVYTSDLGDIPYILAAVRALEPVPPVTTWHERRTMLPDGDARKEEG